MRCGDGSAAAKGGDESDAVGIPWRLPERYVSTMQRGIGGELGFTHLHVRDHLCAKTASATSDKRSVDRPALTIVTLGLFAEPGEERLAARVSMGCKGRVPGGGGVPFALCTGLAWR